MTKGASIQRILKEKVFAVLRLKRTVGIERIVEAILEGGITTVEITLNSGDALEAIHRVAKEFPLCLLGAGTVIGVEAATQAIESGAKFLVSPVTDLDMLAVAQQVGLVSMAGALTPTEAWQASQSGSDFVKLFPLVGLGPQYLRAMRGPFPDIRFVPTNGVTPDNVSDWFAAGASAVGIGTPLVSDRDMDDSALSTITQRARQIVSAARG
ncbi:MAG: bifunctional 4-hydroxy-2-oxoglutarate aldolase/2-dehydro-3-deoxy-phosphogluconate aldolase [Bacteroidota bacterium]|nr:bifunctional 4-hydroxy-2-oxoglutarate aldolase/2-dehydro-3-deoxy-phosphogluconate aldolase [Bacteroidota bacterium]MDP4232120.1 bifunctional 4-hydroxy-2-oxoglutarate aldolase/2-dehydro-3-deoxy-phosphogluconate aldolase [Bacteroidota bacterium]MDP4241172.1 bifunctional 4-hydroxy-2-oxoglutarate aldolase/2-dehydro-3-deoxy-phosphogluconate aldolase [Bacteroidota bacterium]MDP4286564.1 bifunctional 4-hydroxy-2-oxoglutarate aldolase/2-dehydro-3-deoxy-phosphogluconate aldolase [Bacteroidota bacteriu